MRRWLPVRSSKWVAVTGGPIKVDETYIGPNTRKMHANRRLALALNRRDKKAAVTGVFDRESRQIRAKVVPNVKRETLQNEILEQVERGSRLYTDGAPVYDDISAQDYIHAAVNHINEMCVVRFIRRASITFGAS